MARSGSKTGAKKHAAPESDKRSQILRTAQRLFVREGFDEVTMDALAQAVPVSKPTLYNHFKDKNALFVAVMRNRCDFIAGGIEQVLMKEEDNVERALTQVGIQFLSVVLSPEAVGIQRMAVTQAPHFPELGGLFYKSGPLRCKAIVAEYLEKLHVRGKLNVPNAMRASEVFFSMVVGRMQMRLLLGVDKKIEMAEIKEHIRYVVGVFLRGQQPAH